MVLTIKEMVKYNNKPAKYNRGKTAFYKQTLSPVPQKQLSGQSIKMAQARNTRSKETGASMGVRSGSDETH